MSTTYHVKLIRRELIARDTYALYLEKPAGFSFIPGQNIDLGLIDQEITDPNDSARTFSIASAPHEDHLLVLVRMRDNQYKNALRDTSIGTYLTIFGPYGTFGIDNEKMSPVVFIAGGIGITPCLSILRDSYNKKLNRQFYLFYSNRFKHDAACLDELLDLQNQVSDFVCIPTLTGSNGGHNGWPYETGYIDYPMISRYVDSPEKSEYFIVGPSRMVWSMVHKLDGKIERNQMRVEDFTGF